jgi:polyisoprenoid-binding protein YceI
MKKILLPFALVVTLALTSFTLMKVTEWQITEGYSIRFAGKRVNGFFHTLKGQISFDENNLAASRLKMEVQVASITTGNSLKSWHAKRPRWFDAKKYPVITFNSDKFQRSANGYLVAGKLRMRDVEKDVTIPFSFSNNVFFGSFKVCRTDFKVGRRKGFSKLVSDTIRIDFTIPVTKL